MPARFSRELRAYQEEQEAQEAERQRREEEMRSRKHRKREVARDRALKGQLLSSRTARGQPRMQNVLEMVTAKLAGGKPGATKAARLGAAGGRA